MRTKGRDRRALCREDELVGELSAAHTDAGTAVRYAVSTKARRRARATVRTRRGDPRARYRDPNPNTRARPNVRTAVRARLLLALVRAHEGDHGFVGRGKRGGGSIAAQLQSVRLECGLDNQ